MPRRLSVIPVAALAASRSVPLLISLLVLVAPAYPQGGVSSTVSTSQLTGEIDAFLKNEMAAHIADIKKLPHWMIFPTTSDRVTTMFPDGLRRDRLGSLEIDVIGGVTTSVRATGDSALGRGNLGPIPLVLEWERRDFTITPEKPFQWQFRAVLQRAS
jgi:hypothetical protein